MNGGKRKLKSSMPVHKTKNIKRGDSVLKNDNIPIIKKKKIHVASSLCQKIHSKKIVKPKDTEDQQTCKSSNVSLEHNRDSYEYQFERLNGILKESLHCPTLTKDELRILFMKYKLDGHFEVNENLPSVTVLLGNQQNTINDGNHLHNEVRDAFAHDAQHLNCRNNKDTLDNWYYNSTNENQENLKYNEYIHQENHTNVVYGTEENYFSSSSANVGNILLKPHESLCENVSHPCNVQYEHFRNISESLQQNKKPCTVQYFDQPWSPSIYNNSCGENLDTNMCLTNQNNNCQLWKNQNSDCIPETNTFEWQYGVKNRSEHIWNMHLRNTNVYSPMDNENSDHTCFVNYNNYMHQDFDANTLASSVALNNFLPDSTSLLPSFTNVIN